MCEVKLYRDLERERNYNLKKEYYKKLILERMMKLLKEKLLEGHKQYLDKTNFDKSYLYYKEKFRLFQDISKLTIEEVKEIAIGFANSWRSRIDKDSAEGVLEHLKNVEGLLLSLHNDSLIDLNLYDKEEEIKKIYSGFPNKVKPTGRSKILHMIKEEVFPIWDKDIRIKYGVYPNAQGYFNYMYLIQKQVNTLSKEDIKEIEQLTERPIIKVIDEVNWLEVHK